LQFRPVFFGELVAISRLRSRCRIQETDFLRDDFRVAVFPILPIDPSVVDEPAFDVHLHALLQIRADG
jgi:hypothetical protein